MDSDKIGNPIDSSNQKPITGKLTKNWFFSSIHTGYEYRTYKKIPMPLKGMSIELNAMSI